MVCRVRAAVASCLPITPFNNSNSNRSRFKFKLNTRSRIISIPISTFPAGMCISESSLSTCVSTNSFRDCSAFPFPPSSLHLNFSSNFGLFRFHEQYLHGGTSSSRRRRWSRRNCSCFSRNHDHKKDIRHLFKDFSNLSADLPWDGGNVWTTLGTYFFLLHIPLSLGGLSIVAQVLHQEHLDEQTKAISLLFTQSFELMGAILLIQSSFQSLTSFKTFKFNFENAWAKRGWLKTSIAGTSIIYLVVLLTSAVAQVVKSKGMNNIELEQILSSGEVARCCCILVYCVITPILEEYVYRGFLLTSLEMYMEWPLAMILSSCAFSIAHFSIESTIQIFFIGCILGSAYIWSGNLMSSFMIHSVYNFAIIMAIILS